MLVGITGMHHALGNISGQLAVEPKITEGVTDIVAEILESVLDHMFRGLKKLGPFRSSGFAVATVVIVVMAAMTRAVGIMRFMRPYFLRLARCCGSNAHRCGIPAGFFSGKLLVLVVSWNGGWEDRWGEAVNHGSFLNVTHGCRFVRTKPYY